VLVGLDAGAFHLLAEHANDGCDRLASREG
jgi:hypothetical protein